MQFSIEPGLANRAKTPHELLIINLIVFHLLLTPAALALGIGTYSLLLTPSLSGIVIAYIYLRSHRSTSAMPWFLAAHWRLTWQRCKLLLLAYGISALFLTAAWLLTLGIERKETQAIMFTVFTRIGVMPVVLMVFVTFVLESSALYQAGRGEVPDSLIKRMPPPVVENNEEPVQPVASQ